MPDLKHGQEGHRFQFRSYWILFVLMFGVVALSILAFTSPISQNGAESTPLPTAVPVIPTETTLEGMGLTQTAEVEPEPPTPEEIGYTNGIIFWSTILILILLVGTLRETIHRKSE